MKIYTLLLLSVILFAAGSNAQVNLQMGLIAYYPLDNSPLDSGSNHLDLTIFGSPIGAIDRHAFLPGAYTLDSSHPDYFTTAFSSLNSPPEVTLSAWVNLPDAVIDQKIAGRATVGGGGYLLGVDSNKLDAEIWDLNGAHYRLKVDSIPSGVWTHLVLSYKANEYLRAYINGTKRDSIAAGTMGVGASSNWPFTVGGAPWQPTALNANGSIDDIYLYDRALNDAEVDALFNIITSSINGIQPATISTLYPIPLHDGHLSIDFNNRQPENVRLIILNALGENVFSKDLVNPQVENFDLSFLNIGLYSVVIMEGNKTELHRLIVGK